MKIISWNINGIRSINGQNPTRRFDEVFHENKLFPYIESQNPDIICLQETKAELEQIYEELRTPPNYSGWYHSCRRKKGYSGVITYSKIQAISVNNHIGEERFDEEGRIIEMDFGDFVLFNVYFPNGTAGDDRVNFKLDFYDALFNHAESIRKTGKNIIICGDYNTAHHPIDLANPKQNEMNSGFLPIERKKLDWVESLGYVDVYRQFEEGPGNYTWWSNRARARENNVGWRIDYFFVNKEFMPRVKDCYHQPDMMGSDHCPIVLEIEN